MNGQRVVSATAAPQRLPFCDICDNLAATTADRFTELAPDKWWKWFSHPKFAREQEAFMGCVNHPVEPKIFFLDGRVEQYTRVPLTRWQKMTEREALIVAIILAVLFAVIFAWVFK